MKEQTVGVIRGKIRSEETVIILSISLTNQINTQIETDRHREIESWKNIAQLLIITLTDVNNRYPDMKVSAAALPLRFRGCAVAVTFILLFFFFV